MHCPSHGFPDVEIMVGVQVDRGRHGASFPTVHLVTAGVGVAIHWPSHGCPDVEIMVGVHVELGTQGASFPTVQGMTGGGVKMSMQRPPQGDPEVQT